MTEMTRTLGDLEIPAPGTWEIDPAHSSVSFLARYLMLSKVRGRFTKFAGRVVVDEVPERSSAEMEIDAASIETDTSMRDEHLRSPDFLDVERFPQLTFRSTGLKRTGDAQLQVTGDLTIRDVTKPVTLDVTLEGVGPDMYGNTRAAFSARGEIDREEFGITWNKALETGGVLVGPKVQIEIDVQTVAKTESRQAAS